MNTIRVVTLPDRIAIEMKDMEISLDIDSFSWAFQGELWGASSLAMVEPDSSGPKQIEVDINGWKWVFIIERYTSSRAFGKERYVVYGTSRTQLLAAPYAPLRSKSSSSDINAKQAITEELLNTGFTAAYLDTDDYDTTCQHGGQPQRQLATRTGIQRRLCVRHLCRRSRQCEAHRIRRR